MFIPKRCPLCERPGPAPCASCARGLPRAGPVPAVAGLDSLVALFAYEGAVRGLLLALKYRNRRDALGWLAAELAAAAPTPVDAVTWAPTTAPRAASRGFDQAELLARRVGHHLHRPAWRSLRRDDRVAQTGLDAAARRSGLSFTALRRSRWRPAPASVLLVDDVTTTGATLGAAAAALRQAGVPQVHAVVVAHTPARQHAPSSAWQA